MTPNNPSYQPSECEDANRLCEFLVEINHKNPDFFRDVSPIFLKRITEILGSMKV